MEEILSVFDNNVGWVVQADNEADPEKLIFGTLDAFLYMCEQHIDKLDSPQKQADVRNMITHIRFRYKSLTDFVYEEGERRGV